MRKNFVVRLNRRNKIDFDLGKFIRVLESNTGLRRDVDFQIEIGEVVRKGRLMNYGGGYEAYYEYKRDEHYTVNSKNYIPDSKIRAAKRVATLRKTKLAA